MSTENMIEKIREYREYKRMVEEMQQIIDSISDELKTVMTEAGQTKMTVGEYKLSFVDVTRQDIDKKRLEAEHADIYDAYLKEVTYKRFSIA